MIHEAETSSTNIRELARELLHLRLTEAVPSNTNPRLNLETEPFDELKNSILQNGLLQPIVVRPIGDTYEIISGHRRYAAVCALHAERPDDKRFTRIAAVVRDVEDSLVPVLQLAENINRSDLSPTEIADGIGNALRGGATQERLAEQLGWTRRQIGRYVQLNDAPLWLKQMTKEVRVTKKKLDAAGKPVIDPKTNKAVLATEKHHGIAFTYVVQLVMLYNVLHEHDCLQLEELGGENFKPQAERVVRRLATAAVVEGWTNAKLVTEIKRAKDPKPPSDGANRGRSPGLALVVSEHGSRSTWAALTRSPRTSSPRSPLS